jgi:hypothetical protein
MPAPDTLDTAFKSEQSSFQAMESRKRIQVYAEGRKMKASVLKVPGVLVFVGASQLDRAED